MNALNVEGVPCFPQPDIQGEAISEIPARFPFRKALLDQLVELCPVVTGSPETGRYEFNLSGSLAESPIGLRRVSNYHGRSFELTYGSANQDGKPIAIWEDEHKNPFSAISLKGNNFTEPFIMRNMTAPSEYVPHGLLETDSLLRVIRASRLMREATIDTEMIVHAVEPKHFRAKKLDEETGIFSENEYEYVTLPEFKRRLLIDHWQRSGEKGDPAEFQKVSEAINKMAFFIIVRAVAASSRLEDFLYAEGAQLSDEVSRTFRLIEQMYRVVDLDEGEIDEADKHPDVTNPEHVTAYFLEFLPREIGRNLGLLHKLGLVHSFPHTGNVTTLGGLVDLDSVRGVPLGLGDTEVTEEDFNRDVHYFTKLGELRDCLNLTLILFRCYQLAGDKLKSMKTYARATDEFEGEFIASYLIHRFSLDKNITEQQALEIVPKIEEYARGLVHQEGLFFGPILGRHLDSNDVPEVYSPEHIQEGAINIFEWEKANLYDKFVDRLRRTIHDAPVYLLSGNSSHVELMNSTISRYSTYDLREFKYKEVIEPVMNSEDVQREIRGWVKAHKKTESTWSDETLAVFVTKVISERMFKDLVQNMPKDRAYNTLRRFDTAIHTILSQRREITDKEPVKTLLNGNAFALYDNVDIEALIENVAVDNDDSDDEDFDSKNVRINLIQKPGKKGNVVIESKPTRHVKEIFIGGPLQKLDGEELTTTFNGAAKITIPDASYSDYVAWTTRDKKTKIITLHINLTDDLRTESIKKALADKGFVFDEKEGCFKVSPKSETEAPD